MSNYQTIVYEKNKDKIEFYLFDIFNDGRLFAMCMKKGVLSGFSDIPHFDLHVAISLLLESKKYTERGITEKLFMLNPKTLWDDRFLKRHHSKNNGDFILDVPCITSSNIPENSILLLFGGKINTTIISRTSLEPVYDFFEERIDRTMQRLGLLVYLPQITINQYSIQAQSFQTCRHLP